MHLGCVLYAADAINSLHSEAQLHQKQKVSESLMFSLPPAFIPSAFLHMFLLRAMWSLMPVAPGWHGHLSSSYRVSSGWEAGEGAGRVEWSAHLGDERCISTRPGTFCLPCTVHQALDNDKKEQPWVGLLQWFCSFKGACRFFFFKSLSFLPVALVLVPEVACFRLSWGDRSC